MAPNTGRGLIKDDEVSLPAPARAPVMQVWDPPRARWLLQFIETHKGQTGLLNTDQNAARRLAANKLQEDLPRDGSPITPKQVADKIATIARKHFRTKRPYKRLHIDGVGGLDREVLRKDNIYTIQELENWPPPPLPDTFAAQTKGTANTGMTEGRPAASAKGDVNDEVESPSQQSEQIDRARGRGSAPDAANLSEALDQEEHELRKQDKITNIMRHLPPSTMIETMEGIIDKIESAVDMRLIAAGMDPDQATIIELHTIGECLTKLITGVLGCDEHNIPESIQRLANMQSQMKIEMTIFLRGLVACAVTEWVLIADLIPKTETAFLEFHRDTFALDFPIYTQVLKAQVRNRYLDEHVLPSIDRRADALADQLILCLSHFFIPKTCLLREKIVGNVVAVGCDSALWPEKAAAGVQARSVAESIIPGYHAQWKMALQSVFKRALDLRVLMLKTSTEYRFSWIPVGHAVQCGLTQTPPPNPVTLQGGTIAAMGLSPIISSQRRLVITARMGVSQTEPWKVICPGTIYVFKPHVAEVQESLFGSPS